MKIVTPFFASLGFLSRLAPARIYDDDVMSASVKYMPLSGLLIGLAAVAPFWLGVLAGRPWLQAWGCLAFSMWLTRALHWDGWCDLFDAWGSGTTGEKFWEVMKDSRVGAFGAAAMIMGLIGQLLMLQVAFEHRQYLAVPFAFCLGRALAVAAAYGGKRMGLFRPEGLGKLHLQGATDWALLMAVGMVVGAAFFVKPVFFLAPALALACAGLAEVLTLARREEALNGDFLGAAIIWGEISGLLGYAVLAGFMFPVG